MENKYKNLTDAQRRKLLAAAEIVDKGDVAVLSKIVEFTDVIEENTQKVEGMEKRVEDTISEAKQVLETVKSEADAKLAEVKDGSDGESITGEKGEKGDKGERGIDGKQGIKGNDGLNGLDGTAGQDGLPGADGSPDTRLQIVQKINEGKPKSLKIELKQIEKGIITKKEMDFAIGVLDQRTQFLINKVSNLQGTVDSGAGGASAFTALTDTFTSYVGKGSEVVRVNAAETALETVALAGGGDALTTDPLSQFAATTSLQLKNTISDETGSGALVFADTPTLVTPNIGAATGASLLLSGLTASQILATDASKNLVSLAVATYPSLTELTYVKGVTSAIQTQLNAKAASLGADDNYVTDAEKVVIGNTSGTNTGDQTLGGLGGAAAATTITIAGTANQITSSAGAQDLSANRTWTLSLPADVIIPTVLTVPNTGLHLLDSNASHDLIIKPGSNLTADKTLTITTGDADVIVDLTAVTDEYVLAYDTTSNTWRGVVASGGAGFTNLTEFVSQTAWRVFYSNTDGDVTELALGADGTFLKSNGATSAPTFSTPAGSGDVSKVGTPVNNQIGVWTGDGTLEGDAALTYDSTTDTLTSVTFAGNLTGNVTGNASGTAATVTGAAQTAITSLGTLTTLTIDNILINGNDISSLAGTDLTITPLAGQQIVLDGTIVIDAGVVTGATSITSTAFVGALTGNADTVTTNANLTGHITSIGNATVLGTFTLAQLNTAVSDANLARTDAANTFTGIQTMTSPAITTPTGIVKGDVGLGNVDNTSNATERAATATLTNKRITKRTGTTTSSATPTINTDTVDFYSLTAQAADITSFTTNLSGTPTENQTLWIAITGTAARAITWGASFEASTLALPTTTVTTARLDVLFVWNTVTTKWRCIAST